MIRRTLSGFTMIELLFVVAIISILAAISVPNFLEAQTKVKVARVQTDMAATAMAMNRYYADHAAYPPNTPEARRYLDAALQTPIMDATHTSAPADAKIPWWLPNENVPDSGMVEMGMSMGMANPPESWNAYFLKSPVLDDNVMQLTLLTTPISYLGTTLSRDVFSKRYAYKETKSFNPLSGFAYLNIAELFANDTRTTFPGLWGDHLTSSTYFYLASSGPDGEYNLWHPANGPWTPYDTTNGTGSNGDIFHFEGRTPGFVESPEELRPDHLPERW